MDKEKLDAFYMALDNLFKEHGVEGYVLSFGMNGEWYMTMKTLKKDE